MKAVVLSAVIFAFGCATPAACKPAHAAHRLLSTGSIPIGEFSDTSLAPVQKKFDELIEAGDKDVYFRINSDGGDFWAGMDLVKHIRDAKAAHGVRVECLVDFRAISMGFVFLQRICDSRIANRDSVLMMHSVASTLGGMTRADGFLNGLSELEAMNASVAAALSGRLGLTEAEYRAKVDHNEWWMSADAALKAHAIDKIGGAAKFPLPFVLAPADDSLDSLLKQLTGP